MKKIFTTLAMTAASAVAMAQIPSTINYQGVCDVKDADVAVRFVFTQGGEEVYSEAQLVKTNADGLFTAKVGGLEDGWDAINWAEGGVSLAAKINGEVVAEVELATVPYAKVAESYVGQEYIEETVQSVATLPVQVTAIQNILNGNEANEEEGIEANDGLIAKVEQVTNLAQSLSEDIYKEGGLADAVVDLQALELPNVLENLEQMTPMLQQMEENIEANAEAIATVSSDLQEMATLPVQVTAMQTILNGVEANEEEGIEAQDGLIDQVAQVTNLAQSLSEDIYKEGGLADAVVDLQALELPNVLENLEQMTPMLQEMEENIDALQSEVELLFSEEDGPVAALNQGFTQLSNVVSDQAETIEQIVEVISEDGALGVAQEAITVLDRKVTALETATADLEATTNLAQSLSEDLYKEDGLVDAVVALQELNLPNVVENLEQMTPVLQKMEEDIEANTEALANVTSDVQGLEEKTRGFAAVEEVAELKDAVELMGEQIKEINDIEGEGLGAWTAAQIGAVNERVDLLFSEDDGPVAALNTGFTQLSNVVTDAVAELQAENDALRETLGNLINLLVEELPNADWNAVLGGIELLKK